MTSAAGQKFWKPGEAKPVAAAASPSAAPMSSDASRNRTVVKLSDRAQSMRFMLRNTSSQSTSVPRPAGISTAQPPKPVSSQSGTAPTSAWPQPSFKRKRPVAQFVEDRSSVVGQPAEAGRRTFLSFDASPAAEAAPQKAAAPAFKGRYAMKPAKRQQDGRSRDDQQDPGTLDGAGGKRRRDDDRDAVAGTNTELEEGDEPTEEELAALYGDD